MKLKTKIAIAFLTTILVPVILISGALLLFNRQIEEIRDAYGIEDAGELFASNSIQVFRNMSEKLQTEIRGQLTEDVSRLEDYDYLDSLNSQLAGRYSFLIVRKNNLIIYCGSNEDASLIPELPAYGDGTGTDSQSGMLIGNDSQYLVSQMDFTFADSGQGSCFIVTHAGVVLPEIRQIVRNGFLLVIVVLILTALLLTLWIHSSIWKPLNTLKKATREIKNGNLDFEIAVEGQDEISELCQDFEEMRKRLKESAEEKMHNDSENKILISNISHDLKTPLTAIKGYCEGIMDGVASSPEKLDKYIHTIYNKANDMNKLIDELTIYSRIDTNRIPYKFCEIPIGEYFEGCVSELKLDLEAQNIMLNYYNYLKQETVIVGDKEQLKRVINNIIGNSAKYMDKKKGLINIRLRDAGDFVQVEMEDNGRGIAEKDLPHIFDRFYRADASRNSSTGGSGIGLSIVKKIIEDHGGRIWATSKEGTGTIMHCVLRKYQEDKHE